MENGEHRELAELARAARDGDLQAYGSIVRMTRAAVESAARRILHDPDEAEDVAQEAFLQVYHALAGLEDDTALVAWIQRIATNLALNRQRQDRLSFVRDLDVSDLAAPEPDSGDRQAALARALVALPADDRRLCERYYYGGWTTARLADDLGATEAAVRKRLQRTRSRLRAKMSIPDNELPQRIVDLLSKPDLTHMPENPVGALWEEFRRQYQGFEEVDLPERIDPAQVRSILGGASEAAVDDYLGAAERQEWLRAELTAPMLAAASGRKAPVRLIATGKAYRLGDKETRTRLHAFHQAEVFWADEGLNEWAIMGPFIESIERLTAGARLRVEGHEYSLYCDRGWEVSAQWPDQAWNSIAGCGRMRAEVVEQLGHGCAPGHGRRPGFRAGAAGHVPLWHRRRPQDGGRAGWTGPYIPMIRRMAPAVSANDAHPGDTSEISGPSKPNWRSSAITAAKSTSPSSRGVHS